MLRDHCYCVYIAQSSSRRALYIGMTNNLRLPAQRLRSSKHSLHTYDAVSLVYWESFDEVHMAIALQKQLENWRRRSSYG